MSNTFIKLISRACGRAIASSQYVLFDWQIKTEQRLKKLNVDAEELDLRYQAKIVELLRGTPYWIEGHLLLAERAIRSNRIEQAFASGQAVLAQSPNTMIRNRASLILSRCLLKRGDLESAKAIILELCKNNPKWFGVREDLAAVLIQEGDFARARNELEAIPTEQLSGEGYSALEFLRQKSTNIH